MGLVFNVGWHPRKLGWVVSERRWKVLAYTKRFKMNREGSLSWRHSW